MRLIFNWEQFNEAKGDKFLMPLYTSSRLFNKLDGIDNPIANQIADLIDDNNHKYDYTYLDFNPEVNDEISFIQTSRVKRALNIEVWNPDDGISDSQFYETGRTSLKIGRFIKKILPTESDKDIETFVNQWKSTFSLGSEFQVVTGPDIVKWYNEKMYVEGGGTLNNSCMKNAKFLDMYEKNPEVISLIMLVKDGKLLGRALLWKLSEPEDRMFMDRIYTVNDSDVNKFKEYAKSKNYIYKASQSYGEDFYDFSGSIEATIKSGPYSHYPYMDTLYLYDADNGTLYSDDSKETDEGLLKLRETNGLAQNTEGWDDWNDRECDPEQLVYCENIHGYCDVDDAEYLDYLGIYFAPNGDAVYDEISSNYYKKEDCIEFEVDGEFRDVYKGNIVDVIIDDFGNTEKMHRGEDKVCKIKNKDVADRGRLTDSDFTFYLKTLCFRSKGNQWSLNKDALKVYLRKDIIYSLNAPAIVQRYNRFEGAYLTMEDAKKYHKPIYADKFCMCSREDYDKIKWVGMEDNEDIPPLIKSQIDEEIKDSNGDSMYYKNSLYRYFGKIESESDLINSLKLQIIGKITTEIIDGQVDSDRSDFIYDKNLKKYKLSLSEANTDENILVEQDSDGDLTKYLVVTKDELINYIKKCYLNMNQFDTSYYNINQKWEKTNKSELSYFCTRYISNILDEAKSADEKLSDMVINLEYYITLINASDVTYPI